MQLWVLNKLVAINVDFSRAGLLGGISKIVTKFSFTPKSAGYNFGSDRSFDKLYNNGVDQNINNFVEALHINKSCLEWRLNLRFY